MDGVLGNFDARASVLAGVFGLLGVACGGEFVSVYPIDCDDDELGWVHEVAQLVELPPADFGVECGSGWGHGVATQAASEIVELPNDFHWLGAHPEGGLLLRPSIRAGLWSERLGVEVVKDSLLWLDERAAQVRWLREDLTYRRPYLTYHDGVAQLWVFGGDGESWFLSRIEPNTGELLERIDWDSEVPNDIRVAWPEVGGLWFTLRESVHEHFVVVGLWRMSSFGEVIGPLRTIEAPRTETTGTYIHLHPTPDGGVVWGYWAVSESLSEDGEVRWVLDEPHNFGVVDDQGGFLVRPLGGTGVDDQRLGFKVQRRSLADAGVLWTRIHHRFEFARDPAPGDLLISTSWSYAARADGGYLIAGGHAYPSASCPWQPIVWAIDVDGEVEWAHRVEACGSLAFPQRWVNDRTWILGASYSDGDGSNGNVAARWLQIFDL